MRERNSPRSVLVAIRAKRCGLAPQNLTLAHDASSRRSQLSGFEAQAASAQQHGRETTVGNFKVVKTLGVGSFGRVVLAEGPNGERAAIKLLPRGHYVRAAALSAGTRG